MAQGQSPAPTDAVERLIQRPLYVFDLPEELLYTLQLHIQSTAIPVIPDTATAPSSTDESVATSGQAEASSTSTSCTLCNLTFASVQEQRSHVRSDLHGYNLKQKIRGQKPVTEIEFEKLIANLDDSISGSDTSDSDDQDDDGLGGSKAKQTTLSALLKRQAQVTDGDAKDAPAKNGTHSSSRGKQPFYWFTSPRLPPNTSLGIYRAIFSTAEQEHEQSIVASVQRKQLAKSPPPALPKPKPQSQSSEGGVTVSIPVLPDVSSASGPYYFLCMIGGGHFAAMLVSLTAKVTKKFGVEDRSATVIAHKTFHRYTTRRKQGGSQSANDSAGGKAHSAGATIRRHNEVALRDEIRALLSSWKQWIDGAELVFVRAAGSDNRRTIFGPYEGQVLTSKDGRIRGFPFSTRRATQSELMRAFVELTRVKVNVVDEAALAKQAEEAAAAANLQKQASDKPAASKTAKPSKADEEAALHTTQLQGLIRRSKAPGMLSYLQSNNLPSDYRFTSSDSNRHAPMPLHLAAASNSAACVTALLMKAKADPTIANPDGRFPFDLANDRPTRDAFRLARSQLGEGQWNWDAAHVPPALTQTDVDSRVAREKASKAAEEHAEKQRRAAEMQRIRKEDAERTANAREAKFGRGHVMDKPAMTAEERRADEAKGMSDDMRAKLEREKRARAAEERMKRLQGH